jgi:hypothetical protein
VPASGRVSSDCILSELPIVRVSASRRGHRGREGHTEAAQDPGPLTRRETRREQPVVDLARNRKAIKSCGGENQPRIIREAVRWGVDVAFNRRNDASWFASTRATSAAYALQLQRLSERQQ